MEASEITRRNVAIARYMGWRNDKDGWYLFDLDGNAGIVGENYLEAVPAFDSNWSLLMPVLLKQLRENPEVVFVLSMNTDDPDSIVIESIFVSVSNYCLSLEKPASDGKEA
jgi:hypothetical protein